MLFQEYTDIYPQELKLKKENYSNQVAHFLDLNMKIEKKRIIIQLYDKRNDYPFNVVSVKFPQQKVLHC